MQVTEIDRQQIVHNNAKPIKHRALRLKLTWIHQFALRNEKKNPEILAKTFL